MYHIKPDKRSQTSARLIVDGLYRCLDEKNFSQITISDLQRTSYVGRATFYRLFDNLTDVLEYECENAFGQMLAQYRETGQSTAAEISPFEALFTSFMEYWTEHSLLLDALTDSRRMDILGSVFMTHTDEIKQILVPDASLSKSELNYFVSVATAAIFGIFYAWSEGGKKETGSELISALKRAVETVSLSLGCGAPAKQ